MNEHAVTVIERYLSTTWPAPKKVARTYMESIRIINTVRRRNNRLRDDLPSKHASRTDGHIQAFGTKEVGVKLFDLERGLYELMLRLILQAWRLPGDVVVRHCYECVTREATS